VSEIQDLMTKWLALLPDYRTPIASMLCLSPEAYERLRASVPRTAPADIQLEFGGIPIHVKDDYAPDEWRMFDQFGQEMRP